jgi:hypothetical protein
MRSLVQAKFNWPVYYVAVIFIRVVWMSLDWYSFFALCITLHQFMLLFFSMGYVIPIRYLFGSFMCLQMLLGPTFAFNGLDAYQPVEYQMKVTYDVYFSYAIPAVLAFIIGLHVGAGRLKGEMIEIAAVQRFVDRSGNLPYMLIVVGFGASLAATFFATSFAFVFTLLANFKYIGALMLLMSGKQFKTGPLILVFVSIIATSLGEAMFHDLLTWMIMMGAVMAIKYKPSIELKAGVVVGFVLLAVVIQQLKGDYRKAAWHEGQAGAETFTNIYKDQEEGIFKFEKLAKSNVRINQGFIVTNIMRNIPAKEPFANGSELYQILEAAIMPRFLAPNKLNAGDRMIFIKYSGMPLAQGTSMALSSLGDAYINFGVVGGIILMFFFGLLYNGTLLAFYHYSRFYPVLILFVPLVMYYPIRPDCEMQTSLGHLFKSCFLLFIIIQVWKAKFLRIPPSKEQVAVTGI